MNAYFMDAGVQLVVAEYIDGVPRYERETICHLVFAPTRGRAKTLFLRKEGLDFLDIQSVRLVARDVDREAMVAPYDDPLWSAVDKMLDERALKGA